MSKTVGISIDDVFSIEVPDGYVVVGVRTPKAGEWYVESRGEISRCGVSWRSLPCAPWALHRVIVKQKPAGIDKAIEMVSKCACDAVYTHVRQDLRDAVRILEEFQEKNNPGE